MSSRFKTIRELLDEPLVITEEEPMGISYHPCCDCDGVACDAEFCQICRRCEEWICESCVTDCVRVNKNEETEYECSKCYSDAFTLDDYAAVNKVLLAECLKLGSELTNQLVRTQLRANGTLVDRVELDSDDEEEEEDEDEKEAASDKAEEDEESESASDEQAAEDAEADEVKKPIVINDDDEKSPVPTPTSPTKRRAETPLPDTEPLKRSKTVVPPTPTPAHCFNCYKELSDFTPCPRCDTLCGRGQKDWVCIARALCTKCDKTGGYGIGQAMARALLPHPDEPVSLPDPCPSHCTRCRKELPNARHSPRDDTLCWECIAQTLEARGIASLPNPYPGRCTRCNKDLSLANHSPRNDMLCLECIAKATEVRKFVRSLH